MLLPLSTEQVPRLLQLSSTTSTNAELVRLAMVGDQGGLPPFTTLVTDNQTAGRGRRGRAWLAPPGTALAISVLLRPVDPAGAILDASRFSWLPLAAGVAMTDAVSAMLPGAAVGFKWPNDVQVGGRKICGVLGELLPSGDGVVMGAGVNVTMSAQELPVLTATSVSIEAADGSELGDRLKDGVLAGFLAGLVTLVGTYGAHAGDAEASGLRAAAVERCTTLGREVRAELPGGAELTGTAIGIDLLGRLEIRTRSGRVEAVAAGDIIHLR